MTFKNQVVIGVSPKVRDRLRKFKKVNKAKSYNELLTNLMDFWEVMDWF